jgi:hypothetical protein
MTRTVLNTIASVFAAARTAATATDVQQSRGAISRAAALIAGEPSANMLSALALRPSPPDPAIIGAHAAIVAAAMARDMEVDESTIAEIAEATLLVPLGRFWLARESGLDLDVFRALPQPSEARVPALSAGIRLGADEAGRTIAVTAFEAGWLARSAVLGPLYAGRRAPLPRSFLVATARAFAECCSTTEVGARVSAHEVLKRLTEDPVYGSWVSVLARVVGQFPVGSAVVLEDGSWGVVSGPPAYQPERPPVRRVTDDKGRALSPPPLWDLGKDAALPKVSHALDPALCRFNIARAIFQHSLSSGPPAGRGGGRLK